MALLLYTGVRRATWSDLARAWSICVESPINSAPQIGNGAQERNRTSDPLWPLPSHYGLGHSFPMMSPEQNELITRIGPGTKCGALMRHYWHPVALTEELPA